MGSPGRCGQCRWQDADSRGAASAAAGQGPALPRTGQNALGRGAASGWSTIGFSSASSATRSSNTKQRPS